MNKKVIKWLSVLGGVAVIAFAIWSWRNKPITVDAHTAQRGTAIQAVYATGTVEPTVSIPIAPRAAGRLMELRVDEGDVVHKDQVLARLEDANLQRTVDQLAAQERWAKQVLDRAETILARGVGTAADRDKALADWQAAQAATQRSREEQKFMLLTSPSDGVVMRRDGEIGQFIAVNQVLMQLAANMPLRISADVDEEDIALVKPGQVVSIHADAFPTQVYTGSVSEVTPKGDPTTRSYRVRISLPKDAPLRTGMTTDTNIIVGKHEQVLLLPATAIIANHVWVVRDDHLHSVAVTTGINGERKVEILKGIAASDLVVDVAQANFVEGQRVKLNVSHTPAAPT